MDEGRREGNFDVTDKIVAFKRAMAGRRAELKRAFAEVKDHISRAAETIRSDSAAGRQVVPEIDFRDISDGPFPFEHARWATWQFVCDVRDTGRSKTWKA